MSSVRLVALSKSFGALEAVRPLDLDIRSGEFFSILGPSGCGKSTLLRMIAGLETPGSGKIFFDGTDVTSMSAGDRAIGMVFQNYALFPHMTAAQNVAFGLESRRVAKSEIAARVEKLLRAVKMSEKANAPVTLLSGGEQQRVAVARALVVEPSLLLFDEPLSNLDVALRLRLREEIRSLQHAAKITTIYVTHDQAEAMSLSDRIAVMRGGSIEQVGTPAEIYDEPRSPFVAAFVGGANMMSGVLSANGSLLTVGDTPFELGDRTSARARDGRVTVAVKPEHVIPGGEGAKIRGMIIDSEYLGFTTNFTVKCGGVLLRTAMLSGSSALAMRPGENVGVYIDWDRASFFAEHP